MLTLVQEKAYKDPHGEWYGVYQCDCGEVSEIRNYAVKNGHTKSCGCARTLSRPGSNRKMKDYWKDQRLKPYETAFFITMLEPEYAMNIKTRRMKSLWLCYCGKEFVCDYISIKNGHVASCGCARKGKKDV